MLYDELYSGFRWYNEIEKQNRYKVECAYDCGFKLLTPLNKILPFIINVKETEGDSISSVSWKVFCAQNGEEYDDVGLSGLSEFSNIGGNRYIIYNGFRTFSLPCGSYYCAIVVNLLSGVSVIGSVTYYSEIFYIEEFENPDFEQIDFPLFTSWRWHNNQQLQNRYKPECISQCDFYLICGIDTLLPFQFRIPFTETPDIQRWVLRNEDCESVIDETAISFYNDQQEEFTYIYYTGQPPPFTSEELDLPNSNFSTSDSWDSIDEIFDFGWSIAFGRAVFRRPVSAPVSGSAVFSNELTPHLDIIAGVSYTVSYQVSSFNAADGSYFAIRVGDTEGEHKTDIGLYQETLIATNNGYVQLFGFKPETLIATNAIIRVDNISISQGVPLPCGVFESVLTIDGIDYYSEWVQIIEVLDPSPDTSNYILQEDGFRILQEDGYGLLLE